MLPAVGLRTHIRNNIIKSALLLAGLPCTLPSIFFLFFLAAGELSGTHDPLGVAEYGGLVFLIGMVLLSLIWYPIAFFANQQIIDFVTGARELSRRDDPRVWNLLENLCISCGMTMPKLRVIETEGLNAYASGIRDGEYAVTFTRGLRKKLSRHEFEAVLAHELTHIRNRDVQLLVIATVFAGIIPVAHILALKIIAVVQSFHRLLTKAIVLVASRQDLGSLFASVLMHLFYWLLFAAVRLFALLVAASAKFFSLTLRCALSRRREFLADAGAVLLTKNPDALISALVKVETNWDVGSSLPDVKAMFFHNGVLSIIDQIVATHPPIEKRIEALRDYAFGRMPAVYAA
jgi:heat shock protein HtpX